MNGAPLKYKSAIQAYQASMPWDIPMGFLDERGPNGGFVVVDWLEVIVTYNVSTAAGVTTTAADFAAALIGLFEVYEGVAVPERFRLPGFELRQFCLMNADAHPTDPTGLVANTANQTGTLTLMVPFSHPFAARAKDTGVHAFDLREGGGGIRITMPNGWSATYAAGGTPTLNSGTYQVVAHCHEEAGLELKTRWEVGYATTTSPTDLELTVAGKLLAFASLYQAAAGGGSSLANLVDVTSTDYGWKQIAAASFYGDYRRERGAISNPPSAIDPVLSGANALAAPLVFRAKHQKITDHRSNAQKMLFRITSTLGFNPNILTMFVTEKLKAKTSALIAAAGITNPVLVSKGRAGLMAPGALGRWADYLPVKVVQSR